MYELELEIHASMKIHRIRKFGKCKWKLYITSKIYSNLYQEDKNEQILMFYKENWTNSIEKIDTSEGIKETQK